MNRKQRRHQPKPSPADKPRALLMLEKAARLSNEAGGLPVDLRMALARCVVSGAVMILQPESNGMVKVTLEQKYPPLTPPAAPAGGPVPGLWTPSQGQQ